MIVVVADAVGVVAVVADVDGVVVVGRVGGVERRRRASADGRRRRRWRCGRLGAGHRRRAVSVGERKVLEQIRFLVRRAGRRPVASTWSTKMLKSNFRYSHSV